MVKALGNRLESDTTAEPTLSAPIVLTLCSDSNFLTSWDTCMYVHIHVNKENKGFFFYGVLIFNSKHISRVTSQIYVLDICKIHFTNTILGDLKHSHK